MAEKRFMGISIDQKKRKWVDKYKGVVVHMEWKWDQIMYYEWNFRKNI